MVSASDEKEGSDRVGGESEASSPILLCWLDVQSGQRLRVELSARPAFIHDLLTQGFELDPESESSEAAPRCRIEAE